MTRTAKRFLYNIIYVLAVIGVVLGAWAVAAAAVDSEFIVPSISDTFRELYRVIGHDDFISGLCGTLLRSVIGFLISLALFFLSFYFATAYNGFRRIVEPIISAMRSLPAVAVTLILMIAVGSNGTPIILGVLVIYPIMYSSARARTATVETELKEVCRLCGANRWDTFKAIWLPCLAGALPESLSSAFSYNIKAVVGAEILAQTASSLGMLMKLSQVYLQPAMLIALVIAAVVISVLAEVLLRGVLKLALRRYAD